MQKAIAQYDGKHIETLFDHILYDIEHNGSYTNGNTSSNNNNIKCNLSEYMLNTLKSNVFLLLNVGIESTSHAIEYGILGLTKYPKYQQLIYDELISVYETKEEFNLIKINDCHIFRAFVHEIIRCSVATPKGGARSTKESFVIEITKDNISEKYAHEIGQKYLIPKDFVIEPNFVYCFETDTRDIDIENWLKYSEVAKRKIFCNNPTVFSFSLGKRSCPGEPIVLKQMFYTLGSLILRYRFYSKFDFEIVTAHGNNTTIVDHIGINVDKR